MMRGAPESMGRRGVRSRDSLQPLRGQQVSSLVSILPLRRPFVSPPWMKAPMGSMQRTPQSLALLWLCLGLTTYAAGPRDIMGMLQKAKVPRSAQSLQGSCYFGLGLTKCKLMNIYQGKAGARLESSPVSAPELPPLQCNRTTYANIDWLQGANLINLNYGTQQYCLQCCAANKPNQIDESWDLTCSVTSLEAAKSNLYGFEFRECLPSRSPTVGQDGSRTHCPCLTGFIRNAHPGDDGVTWCPLWRTTCKYEADGTLAQDCFKDNTYLAAYQLHLDMYRKTNGLKAWKYIKACDVTVQQGLSIPKMINETLWMRQTDRKWHPAALNILWLLALVIIGVSLIIRFNRKEYCEVCDKPLIYFKHLCWLCRLYGCERPDPNLLARLRARDEALRGKEFIVVENEHVEFVKEKTIEYSGIALEWIKKQIKELDRRAKQYRNVVPDDAFIISMEER
jgi:hypothetical protein